MAPCNEILHYAVLPVYVFFPVSSVNRFKREKFSVLRDKFHIDGMNQVHFPADFRTKGN